MRFRLKAWLEFSSSIGEYTRDLAQMIKEVNEGVLIKGATDANEAARVSSWTIHGNKVLLEIVSGKGVRAHDGLLRIRRYLAQALGSKFKIGLRRVHVEVLEVEVPSLALSIEEVKQKLEGIAEVMATGDKFTVTFRNLSEEDLEDRVIDRALRKLIKEEKRKAKREEGVELVPYGFVLRRSAEKFILFTSEVAQEAERLGWIKRFPARGQWIFTAPMTSLISAIRNIIVDNICKPLGFQEWIFPRLIPFEVLKKLSTYVEHLPEGMFYVCAPPRDPKAFEEFKREFVLRRKIRADILKEILELPSYVLDAIQCAPFYQFFSGELVKVESLPVKVYDYAGGWTWRNEGGGVEGLARTNEFLRLEMVYLGVPEQVVELRDKVVERTIEVIDKVLDLEWRLTVGAPFYLSQEEASRRLVDISTSSKIPALDVECYLPYRGGREASEWLEVSACNVHMTHYVDSFKIKEVKGRELWTGCVGHGLTRWATAFLAQKGFDFDSWPKEVKERIGSLPPPITTLTWPSKIE
ncbi:MAG: serine--tRNA ligase [Candidatus Nezhaarchaeota archaeon]|nr:serine--tRNA ligase [Candidatus Nezhaarchaeota archaeon]